MSSSGVPRPRGYWWNVPTPDRRASDTPRSYAALCDYAAMGAGRSLEKLAERYRSVTGTVPTQRRTTLADWSRSGDWQARVAAYDADVQAELEAERAEIRKARRIALEEADWHEGEKLRAWVQELLAEAPKFLRRTETEITQNGEIVKIITLALTAGPGELARALKLASDVQRLSVGEPTEIHKMVESEIGAFLDRLRDSLPPEEYARIIDIAAGE